MYCGKCGTPGKATSAFCGHCGAPLNRKPSEGGWKADVPEKKRKPMSKLKKILLSVTGLLLAVFLALLIEVGAFGFFTCEHAVRNYMDMLCNVTVTITNAGTDPWDVAPTEEPDDADISYTIVSKEQLLGQELDKVRQAHPDRTIRGATNVKLLVEITDGQQVQTEYYTVALLRWGLTWGVDLDRCQGYWDSI